MILIVDGTLQGVSWTNFTCPVNDPTIVFDFIAGYVARGLRINHARLFDHGVQTDLPPALFNPGSEQCPFEALRDEWEQVLRDRPLPQVSLSRQVCINWNRRLIHYYDRQINQTIAGILRLKQQIKCPVALPEQRYPVSVTDRQTFLLQSRYNRVQALEQLRQNTIMTLKRLEARA